MIHARCIVEIFFEILCLPDWIDESVRHEESAGNESHLLAGIAAMARKPLIDWKDRRIEVHVVPVDRHHVDIRSV